MSNYEVVRSDLTLAVVADLVSFAPDVDALALSHALSAIILVAVTPVVFAAPIVAWLVFSTQFSAFSALFTF